VSTGFAVALATFYEDLAERLLSGARGSFAAAGHGDVAVFEVPGAFELPLAASYAARSGRFAGVAEPPPGTCRLRTPGGGTRQTRRFLVKESA